MFLFDSVKNKYNYYLDWIQDNVVHDKPCFYYAYMVKHYMYKC